MNKNYTMIVRMMILHFHFNNRIKYDHNHAVISQRDSTMGKPLWNTTSGVPQWLAHDGVPQWYSTTGASENVTPATKISCRKTSNNPFTHVRTLKANDTKDLKHSA